MAKFRVGDGVRIIRSDYGAPPRLNGRQATIVEASGTSYAVSVPGEIHRWHYNENELELVTPAQPAELEQLVATANSGLRAIEKLAANHLDAIRHNTARGADVTGVWPIFKTLQPVLRLEIQPGDYFSVKPAKPPFEPFTVGQGWRVELVGTDRVRVGCTEFNVEHLLGALDGIRASSVQRRGGIELHAYRDGVGRTDRPGAEISWADVDRLLEALRGVK